MIPAPGALITATTPWPLPVTSPLEAIRMDLAAAALPVGDSLDRWTQIAEQLVEQADVVTNGRRDARQQAAVHRALHPHDLARASGDPSPGGGAPSIMDAESDRARGASAAGGHDMRAEAETAADDAERAGYRRLADTLLATLLALTPETAALERGRLVLTRARLALAMGATAAATTGFTEAEHYGTAAADADLLACAQIGQARVLQRIGRLRDAIHRLHAALAVPGTSTDPRVLAYQGLLDVCVASGRTGDGLEAGWAGYQLALGGGTTTPATSPAMQLARLVRVLRYAGYPDEAGQCAAAVVGNPSAPADAIIMTLPALLCAAAAERQRGLEKHPVAVPALVAMAEARLMTILAAAAQDRTVACHGIEAWSGLAQVARYVGEVAAGDAMEHRAGELARTMGIEGHARRAVGSSAGCGPVREAMTLSPGGDRVLAAIRQLPSPVEGVRWLEPGTRVADDGTGRPVGVPEP